MQMNTNLVKMKRMPDVRTAVVFATQVTTISLDHVFQVISALEPSNRAHGVYTTPY